MNSYMIRRHPFAFGITVIILSPYLLAVAAVIVLLFGVAVVLDLLCGRR